MIELKPCKCGGTGTCMTDWHGLYYIGCGDCDLATKSFTYSFQADYAWNRGEVHVEKLGGGAK